MIGVVCEQETGRGHGREQLQDLGACRWRHVFHIRGEVVHDGQQRRIDCSERAFAGRDQSVDGLLMSILARFNVSNIWGTDHDQEIRIRTSEVGNANGLRERVLCLEFQIQALPEIRVHAHGLENEDAHPDHALFGGVRFVRNGVEDAENDKIVRAVGVDDKRPKALVALQRLPEEHQHLGGPLDGSLTTRKIGACSLQLEDRRQW